MQDRTSARKVYAEVAALAPLSVKDLKTRWRDIYGTEPPSRISRELLTRAVAYRLQEREFGGLDHRTQAAAGARRRRPVSSREPRCLGP